MKHPAGGEASLCLRHGPHLELPSPSCVHDEIVGRMHAFQKSSSKPARLSCLLLYSSLRSGTLDHIAEGIGSAGAL